MHPQEARNKIKEIINKEVIKSDISKLKIPNVNPESLQHRVAEISHKILESKMRDLVQLQEKVDGKSEYNMTGEERQKMLRQKGFIK